MTKEDIENFIKLCKAFELNPTVSQISPVMVKAFKDNGLFDLLPTERKEGLKKLFEGYKSKHEVYSDLIGRAGIVFICMGSQRAAFIQSVKDAPKESLTSEYVCLNCGNLCNSINAPEKQGCCTVEKYIKNIL